MGEGWSPAFAGFQSPVRTQLILDQVEPDAGADRVRLLVYSFGHMFYTRDGSRGALRTAELSLYTPD